VPHPRCDSGGDSDGPRGSRQRHPLFKDIGARGCDIGVSSHRYCSSSSTTSRAQCATKRISLPSTDWKQARESAALATTASSHRTWADVIAMSVGQVGSGNHRGRISAAALDVAVARSGVLDQVVQASRRLPVGRPRGAGLLAPLEPVHERLTRQPEADDSAPDHRIHVDKVPVVDGSISCQLAIRSTTLTRT
jgi:hypothetical protein